MIDFIALEKTFHKINQRLSKAGIRYHCTGGLAAMLYGEPRFTQDMDLVIAASDIANKAEDFIASLQDEFIFDPDWVRKEISKAGLFQLLDKETCVKIDFHVGEAVPGELDRSVQREYMPGLVIPFVSKEDAILSKLLWIQKGSHKSRQDVIMMLRMPDDPIDWPALEARAEALGVTDLLTELRAQA